MSKAHTLFQDFIVGEVCTWFGCGEPAIGCGLFCDPIHKSCFVKSVCERHKGSMEDWGEG